MVRTAFPFDRDVKRRRGGSRGRRRAPPKRVDRGREVARPTVDSRKPCTAFRPSVIALAASLIAPSSFSFASSSHSGHRCDTV